MPKNRDTKKYVDKILSLMPDDDHIQSKKLRELACERSEKNKDPMIPTTFHKYLKFMVGTYIDKEPEIRKRQKEVYYIKSKTAKLIQLAEDMFNKETDLLLKELRIEFDKTIKLELDYCKKECPFDNKIEERAFVKEILNVDELKLIRGRILVKYGNELIKSAYHWS